MNDWPGEQPENDWPGEQPEHDHPFPPCPACAWALRELEAELARKGKCTCGLGGFSDHHREMKELSEHLETANNELANAWEAHHGQEARAEKAEARAAELEAERVEEQKRWLLEHETR